MAWISTLRIWKKRPCRNIRCRSPRRRQIWCRWVKTWWVPRRQQVQIIKSGKCRFWHRWCPVQNIMIWNLWKRILKVGNRTLRIRQRRLNMTMALHRRFISRKIMGMCGRCARTRRCLHWQDLHRWCWRWWAAVVWSSSTPCLRMRHFIKTSMMWKQVTGRKMIMNVSLFWLRMASCMIWLCIHWG